MWTEQNETNGLFDEIENGKTMGKKNLESKIPMNLQQNELHCGLKGAPNKGI